MNGLMLHAGAQPVECDALRALITPEATETHVPAPHYSVVDYVKHSLTFFGHEIVEQHFGVTEDGMMFFGLLTLKSPHGDYTDTVGLRNSHNAIGWKFYPPGFVDHRFRSVVLKERHSGNRVPFLLAPTKAEPKKEPEFGGIAKKGLERVKGIEPSS